MMVAIVSVLPQENWRNERLNGTVFDVPEDGTWRVPTEGFLDLDYDPTPRAPSLRRAVDSATMKKLSSIALGSAVSENMKAGVIGMAARELSLLSSQVSVEGGAV